MTVNV
jgi:hypothetical protein